MVVRQMWGDITKLVELEDVNLNDDAAGWIIAARRLYDFSLLGAAVLSAYLIVVTGSWTTVASILVWLWFALDYSIRLWASEDRIEYVRGHRIELLACLPLDFFRPLRLLRLVRPLAILFRATAGLRDVLGLTGFTLIGSIGVTVVLLGGAVFAWVEPETAPTIADGMWWSLVTTTTVGYGDISPATTGGRLIAGALMIVGIGMLGAVTGEVAERLLSSRSEEINTGNPEIDHLRARLIDWDEMNLDERRRLAKMLEVVANEAAAGARSGDLMVFGRFKKGNTAALEALANAPVGAATMIEGEPGLIIGTMVLDEAGDRWIEHLVQDARQRRFWISIENYDETKATLWEDIDMWGIEGGPDDQRVVYNGKSFKRNETGTAAFQAKGDVGVSQEGSLDYVDFTDGAHKVSFERFGEAGAHRRSRALSGTCPNCGAPLNEVTDGICSSCGSRLTVDHGWFGSWEVAAGRDVSDSARLQ